MNKHLKLKDILPYFSSESEIIQICVEETGSWERWDELHGDSPLLTVLGNSVGDNYYISDIGCIEQDTIRIMLRRDELIENHGGYKRVDKNNAKGGSND